MHIIKVEVKAVQHMHIKKAKIENLSSNFGDSQKGPSRNSITKTNE